MAITLSKAESWDRIYQASKFINFASFDYTSVKQSLVEYFKLYHPEFNNWIETDEFVMQIEAFAYVCELYSYRLDMVANENLLSTAQRKDSILKLAKFISYNQSRNIPGSGLVKITSISTTEDVYDFSGNNLANIKITWNDANNVNWKTQFFTVISAIINSDFGDVVPTNRVQVFDQIFELYSMKNIPLVNGVISYSVKVANRNIPMELVSAELNEAGPIEQRPNSNNKFNIVYGIDGLGDTSSYTGFFILTKQGSLQNTQAEFDGVTTHTSYSPAYDNVNNTDVWVNQLVNGSDANAVPWTAVDTTNAQNIIFNSDYSKTKYEIETLDNDNVKFLFGDGDFADIPAGTFDFWFRVSDPNPVPIPSSAANDLTTSIAYTGSDGNTYSAIFTFSLVHPIQNAAPSEDKEHIKVNAPAVYYTQNRMVNGQDYNSFLLQDHSILKLAAVNRTFAGHSKYTGFSDASGTYEHINHFGADLSLYIDYDATTITAPAGISAAALVSNYIQPLLSNTQSSYYRLLNNQPTRRLFSTDEKHTLIFNFLGEVYSVTDTNPPNPILPVALYYESTTSGYVYTPKTPVDDNWVFHINKVGNNWVVKYRTASIVVHSPTTKFWNNNADDTINILDINPGSSRTATHSPKQATDIILPIAGTVTYTNTINIGLPDYNSLYVSMSDANNDGVPDVEVIQSIINNTIVTDVDIDKLYEDSKYNRLFNRVFNMPFDSYNVSNPTVQLDYDFITSDVKLIGNINNDIKWAESAQPIANSITVTNPGPNSVITAIIPDFVYFYRTTVNDSYAPATSNASVRGWLVEKLSGLDAHYTRKPGRSNLNFLWQHAPANNTIINPSTSNIIDCFIITKGYYENVLSWLKGYTNIKPEKPTPYELTNSYGELMQHKMISDELVLSSGEFKVVFGKYAAPELQATIVVVKSTTTTLTDNQIKASIVDEVYNYFDINYCNFGDTFNFTTLSAHLHNMLGDSVLSIVIKPRNSQFGELFQIHAMENEIIVPSVTLEDIDIVSYLTSMNIGVGNTKSVSDNYYPGYVDELTKIITSYEANFTTATSANAPFVSHKLTAPQPSPIDTIATSPSTATTLLVDKSQYRNTVSNVGGSNASTSTSGPFAKVGSAYFPESTSMSNIPSLSVTGTPFNFGTGDFTFEFWYYAGTLDSTNSRGNVAFDNGAWQAGLVGTSWLFTTTAAAWKYITIPNAAIAKTWTHIALTRTVTANGASATYKGFVNGKLAVTTTITNENLSGSYATINANGNGIKTDAIYYSNIRSVIGTAQYTADFVPATSALTVIPGTSFLMNFTL